jgi:hypothetical protein
MLAPVEALVAMTDTLGGAEVSPIGIKEPGMIGVIEPVLGS